MVETVAAEENPAGPTSSPFPRRGITPGCTYASDLAPVMKPKLKWTTSLSGMFSHEGMQPIAGPAGKHLYVKAGGTLYKLDAETGNTLWQEAGGYLGFPTIEGNTLLITGGNWLKALDISGEKPKELWVYKTEAAFQAGEKAAGIATVTVAGDIAMFGSGRCALNKLFTDTKLYAVNWKTGKEAWVFDCQRMVVSPCAVDLARQLGYFAASAELATIAGSNPLNYVKTNGMLIALDLRNGKEEWRAQTGNSYGTCGPAVADGVVYCGGDTEVMAFNADNGQEIWRAASAYPGRFGRDGVAVVTPESVIMGTVQGGGIESHDRKTGKLLWKSAFGIEGNGLRCAARNVLYTASYFGKKLYGINIADGKTIWEIPKENFAKGGIQYGMILDGRLIYGDYTPAIYCLENEK